MFFVIKNCLKMLKIFELLGRPIRGINTFIDPCIMARNVITEKTSLEGVLLHTDNEFLSMPVAYASH